ncbi:MAG: hypothetical protein JWO42_1930 [Chloroflexi bacterium]|nr:hypothetical protein [Chloroflexota bacterium]
MDALSGKPRRVLTGCDGHQLQGVVATATSWLVAHAPEVDALNVYPVPDGDTGSNMSQTMRAALDCALESRETDVGQFAARLAHGALMGARGNSGVILSQLLRGFARSIEAKRTISPLDLAQALADASAMAYRAVMKPVEGTVLTVARVAAERALEAAVERPEFSHVLSSAVSAGRRALAETRNQLPALRQAGVVDAGGQGYLFILEGALRHLQGKTEADYSTKAEPSGATRAAAAMHAQFEHAEGGFGYCTEFLIVGASLSEHEAREHLAKLGDSLLVVGNDELLRVHIHTEDPGRAMAFATSIGRLRQVKVQDMQEQHEEFVAEVLPPELKLVAPQPVNAGDALPIGVVAVAIGDGFAAMCESLGATVVPGGQTMNPSTQQILAAIDSCTQDTVIVLPNNGNVLSTAEQAAALSRKTVHVLPCQTMPQGIAALLAIRYDEELDDILTTMRAASDRVRTIEITTAVRDAELDGLQVRSGDVLGLVDGELKCAGSDVGSVVTELLEAMPADDYEIVTMYTGADTSDEQAQSLQKLLTLRYPRLTVEQHQGDQPHYQFILSIE